MVKKKRRPSFTSSLNDVIAEINFRPKRVRTTAFIQSPLNEHEEDIESKYFDPSVNATTTQCSEFTVFGRCLGNHPSANDSNVSKFNIADINFASTLNSTLHFKPDLSQSFRRMPKWATELYLKALPVNCTEKRAPLYKNPVGSQLANVINKSIRVNEAATSSQVTSVPQLQCTSSSVPQHSTVDDEDEDSDSTVVSVPVAKPRVHTMKVRIQKPTFKDGCRIEDKMVESSSPTLEHWSVIAREGEVCLKGTNIRTRKNIVTDPVARCITPRTVECSSGVLCRLIGSLSNDKNELPSAVADKFEMGFPSNWKEVLQIGLHQEDRNPDMNKQQSQSKKNKVQDTKTEYKLSESNQDESIRDVQMEPKKFPIINTARFYVSPPSKLEKKTYKSIPVAASKIATKLFTEEFDGDNDRAQKLQERHNTSKNNTKKLEHSKPQTKRVQTDQFGSGTESRNFNLRKCCVIIPKLKIEHKFNDQKDTQPAIIKKTLTKWAPVLGKTAEGICVSGYLADSQGKILEMNHITAEVTNCLSSNVLQTKEGIQYTLVGPPNMKPARETTPIPLEIRDKFTYGFPHNWLSIARTWHDIENKQQLCNKTVVTKKFIKTVKVERTEKTKATKARISSRQKVRKLSVVSPVEVKNSKELAGIKVAVSSRGRKIIQPLKYWESERVQYYSSSKRVYDTTANDSIISNTPSPKHKNKDIDASPMSVKKPRAFAAKVKKQSSKKPVVAKQTTKKMPEKKKKVTNLKGNTTTATQMKTTKPVPEDFHFNQEEMRNILSQPIKTLRQRQKREKVMHQIQKENAQVDNDLFASGCSGLSDDDFSETMWDADSVSSKVTTSDEERMTYNYTPPGVRMAKLMVSPTKQNDESFSPTTKPRDYRTLGFIHRQLKKPKKLLTKKQLDQQKDEAQKTEMLKKYYNSTVDGASKQTQLANKLLRHWTEDKLDRAADPGLDDFWKDKPLQSEDSDIEKYYTDDEQD